MKYARFEYHGKVLYGIVERDEIRGLHGSILEDSEESGVRYLARDVRLLSPITPTKIVCIGQNYLEHIKEIGATPTAEPLFFLKPPSSVVGPNEEIIRPPPKPKTLELQIDSSDSQLPFYEEAFDQDFEASADHSTV